MAAIACGLAAWSLAGLPASAPLLAAGEPAAPGSPPASQPASQPADTTALKPLLDQLSDPDWRVRQKAEEQVVTFGGAAVTPLKALVAAADRDDTRTAALNALKKIEEHQRVGPSLVTLHLKDAPVKTIMTTLAEQAHFKFDTQPEDLFRQPGLAKTRLSIDADREPFWKVMRDVQAKTGLDLTRVEGQPRLMDTGMGPRSGRAVVAGAFLVSADQLSRSQSIDLTVAQPTVLEEFGMQLTVYPEPKLRVLEAGGLLRLTEAVDDNGNSLIPPSVPGLDEDHWSHSFGTGDDTGFGVYARLQYPKKNPGARIARLVGSVPFKLQVQSEKLDVPLAKLAQTSRTVLQTPVTFRPLRREGASWQLGVVIGTNDTAAVWEEIQKLLNGMRLVDANGQPLNQEGYSIVNVADSSIEVAVGFGASQRDRDGRASTEPTRLTWEIPTETRVVEVPVELTDLMLPR